VIGPGDVVGPVERVPDPERMKLMAALLRDPNPIHFDVESVTALGLGDRVITQGPMTVSYLADMLTAWGGGTDTLRSLHVRMLGNVFAGDTVVCRGRVVEVDDAGEAVVEVEAVVGDVPVVKGTARVSTGMRG
jgi:acyl dehydratase